MNKFSTYFEDRLISCSDEQYAKLEKIRDITLKTNKLFNLTAITDPDDFMEKMVVDSALALTDLDLSQKKVIDVGTGAGFPGLVIATLAPNCDITLLDSTAKKINYLENSKNEFGLNYHTVTDRAEDYAIKHREEFDYAFARAVAPLNILMELIIPMLKVGGVFVAMKGPGAEDEINVACNAFKKLGCHLRNVKVDNLPISNDTRNLIYIVKDTKTQNKYPRQYSEIKAKAL